MLKKINIPSIKVGGGVKEKCIFKDYLFLTLFLALLILFCFGFSISLFPNSVTDNIMGNALLYGVDVTKRVKYFYGGFFIFFPLIFIFINFLLMKFCYRFSIFIKKQLNFFSIVGIMILVMNFICKLKDPKFNFSFSLLIVLAIILLLLITGFILLKHKNFNEQNICWALIAAVPFAFFTGLILKDSNQLIINVSLLISYIIITIILFLISNSNKINYEALKKSATIWLLAPIFESLYLEIYNILNQYDIVISRKLLVIFFIYVGCFFGFLISYLLLKNKKINFNYKKHYYPILILIFALIYAEIHLVNVVNEAQLPNLANHDLFETANYGESVYEFLSFGKFPILETFDAHMLKHSIWGILYGLLNNDIHGSIFCLYSTYSAVLIYLVLFFFFKMFFSEDFSLSLILFVPLTYDLGLWNYFFGLICIMSLIKSFEKNKFFNFWILMILSFAYSLDIGLATLLSCFVIILIYYIKNNKSRKVELRKIFIPLFIILTIIGISYICLCIFKNINPISRFMEFVKISLSNINWAYKLIGDTNRFSYVIVYFLNPIILVLSLIFIFHQLYSKKINLDSKMILLLFLGLFYIFNFQRGIVRHSLYENNTYRSCSFFIIYVVMFAYYFYFKKYRKVKFIGLYFMLILFNQLIINGNTLSYQNLLDVSIPKYTSMVYQKEKANGKVQRMVFSEKMSNEISEIKDLLNNLLEDNETYLDFSNQTLLYALIGKEKPVYVNQSPGLLSGEFSQKKFLEEIKNFSPEISIVLKAKNKLFADGLDEIYNDYRYYLISEEIYKNYVPLAIVNNYEIWVKKEKEDAYLQKIKNYSKNINLVCNENYLINENKEMNLHLLPYIFGNEEENNKYETLKTLDFNENDSMKYQINSNDIDKSTGNYISINLTSDFDSKVTLQAINGEDIMQRFIYDVQKGTHTYLIRISTIYAWYNNIDFLKIISESEIKVNYIKVLKG